MHATHLFMLTCLRVRNFAIIDSLEVELGPGLNVVTGETGAGKSIMVAALQLVLGGKGRADVVRTGAKCAEVEALFDVGAPSTTKSEAPSLRERLAQLDIEVDGELLIRRTVFANGRTRAYINGHLSTAEQLRFLAAGLADISSQHEHHTLIDPRRHLEYLDAFGCLEAQRAKVEDAYHSLAKAARGLAEHDEAIRTRADREDLLRFQVKEIDELMPVLGEAETLEEEGCRLRHASRLMEATGGAESALYSDDGSLTERLGRIVQQVRDAAGIDSSLGDVATGLEGALAQLEDASSELGRYSRQLSADPTRLAEVETRLSLYARLQRKYGPSVGELMAHHQSATEQLDAFENTEDRRQILVNACEAKKKAAAKVARALSKSRSKHASALGKAISSELHSLGMGSAHVEVDMALIAGDGGSLEIAGGRLTPSGIDRAEFLIAPNKGETARPLSKVASGGELSRSLLAIKRVLAGLRPTGMYVFDEVDTGVGGAIAEVIGTKLVEVAQHHQVLCITHLAQIAVYGDTHFQVSKEVDGERTRSVITRLSDAERLEEVARMVGGMRITRRTRAAAAELLAGAQAA
ncbi:MAG: DNA repair protein RecN (Recombination protein N) [Polyangiales bacterium]|jgi:DNA repair protein RecN (Recombination protein N)